MQSHAIYTTSYKTIEGWVKDDNTVYIQVSRNLGHYAAPDDKTGLAEKIDENWGEEFGNWWNDKTEYKKCIRKKDLRLFAKHLRELKESKTVYLLCFENVLAGEVCHRRWLAEILEKGYGLKIEEWNES